MLTIVIPYTELWDDDAQEFLYVQKQTITLEHSLLSISKWESRWKVPYLSTSKTYEQQLDYFRCMTLTPNVHPLVYKALNEKHFEQINAYIDDPMTASVVRDTTPKTGPQKHQEITSELIYYWMVALTIPFECQKWHLNRLLMLINITNVENNPKKMSKTDSLKHTAAVNKARRSGKKF